MDYDDVLEHVGGCGPYQCLLVCLIFFISIKAGANFQMLVLQIYTPTFVCRDPWYSELHEISTASCEINGTQCKEWRFDTSQLHNNVVTEFLLICSRAYLAPMLITVTALGSFMGCFLGTLGDRIGRRWLILSLCVSELLLGCSIAFVPAPFLWPQFVLRFLHGVSSVSMYQACTYITEIVSKKHRMAVGANYWAGFSLGYAIAAGLGTLFSDWRMMQLSLAAVGPAYFTLFLLLPESPRWLLVRDRKPEAAAVLRRFARGNGRVQALPTGILDALRVDKVPSGSLNAAFSTSCMRNKTIAIWLLVWTFSLSYNSVSLDSNFGSDNIFVSGAVLGLVEIPAGPIAWIMGQRLGRRSSTLLLCLTTGLIMLTIPFSLEFRPSWIRTVVAGIAKLLLTTGYNVVFIWIAELFPVNIRNVGVFSAVLFGVVGSVVAPLVLASGSYFHWLPSAIITCWIFFSALASLFLPETKGVPLQQTVQEADLLKRGREGRFEDAVLALHVSHSVRIQCESKV